MLKSPKKRSGSEIMLPANEILNEIPPNSTCASKLLSIEKTLCNELSSLNFSTPYVLNPLIYARNLHEKFYNKFLNSQQQSKRIMFLGMNPGPFGMTQTGIPFGYSEIVTDWFEISGEIDRPKHEHPRKPILGLKCQRKEQSGLKFWGLMKELCKDPHVFFQHCLVYNLCPLNFVTEDGRNLAPSDLKDECRFTLYELCENALLAILIALKVEIVIGIGRFASKHAEGIIKKTGLDVKVYSIPHPSPLNRKSKSWREDTLKKLQDLQLLPLLCPNAESCKVSPETYEFWMREALKEANTALQAGEVPVGCLFIHQGKILVTGSNAANATKNATRHAELTCVDQMVAAGQTQLFQEIDVVVTVEPCIMCASALHQLGVKSMIFGCSNPRFGGCESVLNTAKVHTDSKTIVVGGILAEEAISLLKSFYEGTNPNAPESKVKRKKRKIEDSEKIL